MLCYTCSSDVRAGTQHSLRMFISHTRQLFLHKPPTGMLSNQVDSGNRIIKLYQEIMLQWSLDLEGWMYLLKVVLHLCLVLVKDSVPPHLPTLGTNMADILLQVSITIVIIIIIIIMNALKCVTLAATCCSTYNGRIQNKLVWVWCTN